MEWPDFLVFFHQISYKIWCNKFPKSGHSEFKVIRYAYDVSKLQTIWLNLRTAKLSLASAKQHKAKGLKKQKEQDIFGFI